MKNPCNFNLKNGVLFADRIRKNLTSIFKTYVFKSLHFQSLRYSRFYLLDNTKKRDLEREERKKGSGNDFLTYLLV